MWKLLIVSAIVVVAAQAAPQAPEEKFEPVNSVNFVMAANDIGILEPIAIISLFVCRKKSTKYCVSHTIGNFMKSHEISYNS